MPPPPGSVCLFLVVVFVVMEMDPRSLRPVLGLCRIAIQHLHIFGENHRSQSISPISQWPTYSLWMTAYLFSIQSSKKSSFRVLCVLSHMTLGTIRNNFSVVRKNKLETLKIQLLLNPPVNLVLCVINRVRNTEACVLQEDMASPWHLLKLCCILALLTLHECPSSFNTLHWVVFVVKYCPSAWNNSQNSYSLGLFSTAQ